MKTIRVLGLIIAVSMVVITMAAGQGDVWNKKTTMTFSGPFEVPGGQVLPAGTYVFKLLDSSTEREIVQIFNEDQTHVYVTILAIPNRRANATEETVVSFAERASGSPQAIKMWFHPNSKWGHEFVYPKARAIELAKAVNEPVPAVAVEPATVAELKKEPIVAETPKGEEVPVAQAFEPVQVAEALPQTATLPKTASSLPLIGLIGLMSLAAAFTLLLVTKRIG